MPFRQARKQPTNQKEPDPKEQESDDSDEGEQGPQPEAGPADRRDSKYRSDGSVLQELIQFGGVSPLIAEPPEFIRYGSTTGQQGDGLRRPGPFQQKYENVFTRYVNIPTIPFTRFLLPEK